MLQRERESVAVVPLSMFLHTRRREIRRQSGISPGLALASRAMPRPCGSVQFQCLPADGDPRALPPTRAKANFVRFDSFFSSSCLQFSGPAPGDYWCFRFLHCRLPTRRTASASSAPSRTPFRTGSRCRPPTPAAPGRAAPRPSFRGRQGPLASKQCCGTRRGRGRGRGSSASRRRDSGTAPIRSTGSGTAQEDGGTVG
jgi:hypothetical protein